MTNNKMSDNISINSNNKRVIWLDYLRAAAILAVLFIHISGIYYFSFEDVSTKYWLVGTFWFAFSLFAVPVFIMISGYLLLNRTYEIKDFLRRRFKRVLVPFIFWNCIYIIYLANIAISSGESFTLLFAIKFIIKNFLSYSVSPLWFVYLILGLYLFIPIISVWIQNVKITHIEYFLCIWILTLFLGLFFNPKGLFYPNMNFELNLQYFSGYLGYLVLGYYLRVKKSDLFEKKSFALTLFLIGLLITFLGTAYLSFQGDSLSQALREYLLPNIFIQSMGIFLIFKNFNLDRVAFHHKVINRSILAISKYSYGTYLVHYFFFVFIVNLGIIKFNPVWAIPAGVVFCLLGSLTVLSVMNKIPFLKEFAGT